MRILLVIFVAAFVWPLCRAKAAVDPRVAEKKLYVLKCAKCHELYDPKKYNDADWDLWMTKMEKKSKLKPEQAKMIRDYTKMLRVPVSGPVK